MIDPGMDLFMMMSEKLILPGFRVILSLNIFKISENNESVQKSVSFVVGGCLKSRKIIRISYNWKVNVVKSCFDKR